MKHLLRPASVLCLCTLLLFGCDLGGVDDETAPPMLPADAFRLEANLFRQDASAKTAAGAHFTAAALRVWPVSLILGVNLVIPVAVTAAALQARPELDDGAWVWASTATANGQTVTFRLAARLQGGTSYRWSMRVSTSAPGRGEPLDDFELYTAVTDLSSQSGFWDLFYRIDGERRNVLEAEFGVDSADGVEIVYAIPESAEHHAGDTVRFAVEGDVHTFEWIQTAEGLTHLVTWNTATGAGSITATNYNGGARACWDANLDDVACPG